MTPEIPTGVVYVLHFLNALVLTWIRLSHCLYCPYCTSNDFGSWSYYRRIWQVPGYGWTYSWRVKRFRCTACQRTFSSYTNTRWAHKKSPPLIEFIPFSFLYVRLTYSSSTEFTPIRAQKALVVNNPRLRLEQEFSQDYQRALTFLLASCLNETQRRLVVALETIKIGKTGIHQLHELTGMAQKTIRRGRRELEDQMSSVHRDQPVRRAGAGRLKITTDLHLNNTLDQLLADETAGDPMKDLKWTRKSLRKISRVLADQGVLVAPNTIRKILKAKGYSLKVNSKRQAFKAKHPLRNAQFVYINQMKAEFIETGTPVISIDGKKKELIGKFHNPGQTWRQEAFETWDHEFPDQAIGKLVPYGIYDLSKIKGYIYAGTNHSTAEFAVDGLVFWWKDYGSQICPYTPKILLLCDCGGANSCHSHLWKWELQEKLADPFGLTIYVCHYPPGTSKWNPIEHRLFSFISHNWAGRPLTSYELALNYIRTTTTKSGLEVKVILSERQYLTGREIPQELVATINLTSQQQAPSSKWNYIIAPRDEKSLKLRIQIQEDLDKRPRPKRKTHTPKTLKKLSSKPINPTTAQQTPKKILKPIFYSIKEVAAQLNVCPKTIRRWDTDGKIKCCRTVGNHRRIPVSEIRRLQLLRNSSEE